MYRIVIAAVIAALATVAYGQTAQFASFDLASEQVLNDPHDLELGPDGNIYVADKLAGRIVVMDPETLEVLWTFGDGHLSQVRDISFAPDGLAYLAVSGASRVDVYAIDGQTATHQRSLNGVAGTEGVLAHSNGDIYAMASRTGQLVRFSGDGEGVATPSAFFGAHDVEEAPDGTIWVADNRARRLVQLSAEMEPIKVLDDSRYFFLGPRYLDIDAFGRLVVADQDAHRILLIDPDANALLGVIGDGSPGLGPGRFDDPEGVLVVGSRYYFADSDNNRIVRYSVVIN